MKYILGVSNYEMYRVVLPEMYNLFRTHKFMCILHLAIVRIILIGNSDLLHITVMRNSLKLIDLENRSLRIRKDSWASTP